MTKEEFMQRFQLLSLSPPQHKYRHNKKLKLAAVLVPIIIDQNSLSVILTKRASHLNHHPGQISFPGGKVEAFDKNAIATALRETHEEIGIENNAIKVIGQLHNYQTITGYDVTPIVGLIESKQDYIVDENEVAEVFQVPLSHFLSQDNQFHVPVFHHGKSFNVQFMPYLNYNIWGATAAMLRDLSLHIS
jgi:8-oxo-dGTP pyrophosphatase MutT (NUDIX family)